MQQEIFKITPEQKAIRLDIFLSSNMPTLTRSYIKTLIENGNVLVNNKKVKSGYSLKVDDTIIISVPEIQSASIEPENIPLDIIYQDEYLAVINKPQGMTVHPAHTVHSGTLVNALMYHIKDLSGINGEIRPGIVHRLDKDTSGLLVIAKDDETHLNLQKQIQNKSCHRIYKAVTYGKFNLQEGVIQTNLARGKSQHEKIFVVPTGQGRLAITNYKVLDYNQGFSFVEYELKTGRTHQIRVHSAHLGHAIVGDKVYGKPNEKFGLNGQLLHAQMLVFTHPVTKQTLTFTAPLPEYFVNFLKTHNLQDNL